MTRRKLLAAASLCAAGSLVEGCGMIIPQWRYRYRLTATLARGSQTVQGSSLVQVVRTQGYTGIGGDIDGEAAAVDVPGVGTLFVLLSNDEWGTDWPLIISHHVFAAELGSVDMVNGELLDRLEEMTGSRASIPLRNCPTLVTFGDPQDPATVERIAPDDLPAKFAGFELHDLTLELTDAAPRETIYAKLPWLKTHKGALTRPGLDVPISERPFSATVNEASFIQGSIKSAWF